MLTLLALLQDGKFHSGETLGNYLGVSRAAVWKKLQELEAETGISVHKVRGRGYRLASPLVLLARDRLLDNPAGWPVHVLDRVGSTNAEAFKYLESKNEAPFFIVSESQTAGRGRRGRQWISPFAENLYYSLALRIDGGASALDGLSLVVGLAVCAALREQGVAGVGVKWPNDLLVSGKKIAGILLEMSGDPADICHVVIGIGINVNMLSVDGVDQPWTSVRKEMGSLIDRNALVSALSAQLHIYLSRHRRDGFSALRAEWEAVHLWQGRSVRLSSAAQGVDGEVLGVDARGALRLLVDGVELQYSGGELSLRLRDDS